MLFVIFASFTIFVEAFCSSSDHLYDVESTGISDGSNDDTSQLDLLASVAERQERRQRKSSGNSSSTATTPGYRKGKSKILGIEVEDLMHRAEHYFDEHDFTIPEKSTKYYDEQAGVLRNALLKAPDKILAETGKVLELNDAKLKPYFIQKVQEYHSRRVADRGRERLRREEKLNMSREEFEAVRKHFYRDKERDTDPKKAHRITNMKWKYRKALEKNPNDERMLRLMREKKWTMEDLKRNRLPSGCIVRQFLEKYREGLVQSDASEGKAVRGNRSNPDMIFDLNEETGIEDVTINDEHDQRLNHEFDDQPVESLDMYQ